LISFCFPGWFVANGEYWYEKNSFADDSIVGR